MTTFTIDSDDHITRSAGDHNSEGADHFSSLDELAQLAKAWPMPRLIRIWNRLPGATPVKRFTDRQTALSRIWKSLLSGAAKSTARSKKRKRSTRSNQPARAGTKKAQVIRMLQRPNGASVKEIMRTTAWQAHTVRGFISRALVHNLGLKVVRFKREKGQPAYQLPR